MRELRTVLLIILVVFFMIAAFIFVRDPGNHAALTQPLTFFELDFSVVRALAVAFFLGCLLPGLYFTRELWRAGRQLRIQKKGRFNEQQDLDRLSAAQAALAHQLPERALKLLKGLASPRALYLQGHALTTSGDPAGALEVWKKAFNQYLDPPTGYLLAERFAEQGKDPSPIYRKMIEATPSEAQQAYQLLARHYLGVEEPLKALQLLEDAKKNGLQLEQNLAYGIRLQAYDALALEQPKQAADGLRALIKTSPKMAPAHLALGEQFLQQGQAGKAFKVWRKGFEVTGNPALLTRLSQYHRAEGDPESARDVLQQAARKTQRSELEFLLALHDEAAGLDDRVLEICEALKTNPTFSKSASFWHTLAQARRREGMAADRALEKVGACLGFQNHHYRCSYCQKFHDTYQPYCQACGHWDTIMLDVTESKQDSI